MRPSETRLAIRISLALLGAAAPARASSAGGDGDPSRCAGSITVKTAPIYGTRGAVKGKEIGQIQLRWAGPCSGNWSRVILWGGLYKSPVTIAQTIDAEGRHARADEFGVKIGAAGVSAWSPYLKLRNSQSRACAQVWVSSDFGTLNYHTNGAQVCA